MVAGFPWLDATEWQAVGTIALVLITGVYVVLTGRVAKSAAESAAAARAGLPVLFSVDVLVLLEGEAEAMVFFKCHGARVWVHDVRIKAIVRPTEGQHDFDLDIPLKPMGQVSVPIFHHQRQASTWKWTGPVLRPEMAPKISFSVSYSFTKGGEENEVRVASDKVELVGE